MMPLILLVFAAVWILFLKKPKEIDQKILFIYRQEHYGCFSRGPDKGYYIDNRGNKVEYDLDAILGKGDWDREMDRVVEILNTMQVTESTPVFSERKLARLYRYLYRIDIEAEKEMTLEGNRHAFGNYRLYAVRYQENGEPEIIKLFEAGYRYGVNPDPYAQKIKTALLRENPIWAY